MDGRLVGRAPLSLSLEAGLHEVRLLAPGYAEYRARVEVRPEETLRLSVELVPLRATLEVYVNVEARVFLDGEEVGRTREGYLRTRGPLRRARAHPGGPGLPHPGPDAPGERGPGPPLPDGAPGALRRSPESEGEEAAFGSSRAAFSYRDKCPEAPGVVYP